MTETITALWKAIKNWLQENIPQPPDTWGLLPPANDAQIDQIAKETGYVIPDDLRQLLKIHNGQDMRQSLGWLPFGMNWISCEMIISEWYYWMGLYEKYGEGDLADQTSCKDQIRDIVFTPKRLMVAELEGIAMMFLDGVPGPKGIHGQVITNITEIDFVVLAPNLTRLLEKYLHLMKQGKIYFDQDTYETLMPTAPEYSMIDLLLAID